MRACLLIGSILPLLASAAFAQTGAGMMKPFADCATIAVDAERLSCYDRAAAAVSPAARDAAERRAAAAAVAAQQAAEEAEAERVAAFGRSSMPGAAADAEGAETIAATIRAVDYDALKRALVSLDNGQVWRQSSNKVPSGVRPGTRVTLKEGTMGSVRMVTETSRPQVMWVVRVR